MIILIGGTGFIGKHLSVLLHEKHVNNISLSRNPDTDFVKNYAPTSRLKNILHLDQNENVDAIKSADAVVYLASSSIPASKNNSIQSELRSNIIPTIDTLSRIIEINPGIRIIFISSGGTVYGPEHEKPIKEDSLLNPTTPYAFGKLAIENYLKLVSNTGSTSYTVLRVSNPVGKWHCNAKQGFVGAAIGNIRSGQGIKIYGDGEIVRDYVDADELASVILRIYQDLGNSKNKIWNVGSGQGTSLNQIVRSLESLAGKNLNVNYLPHRSTDLPYNVLDCSKINKELGWKAELGITGILEKAWAESQNR